MWGYLLCLFLFSLQKIIYIQGQREKRGTWKLLSALLDLHYGADINIKKTYFSIKILELEVFYARNIFRPIRTK